MRTAFPGLLVLLMTIANHTNRADDAPIRLVIHGGAGAIERARLTPELQAEYGVALARSLVAGHAVLASGGSSVDAVIAAIVVMEDSPLFNAGKGAVFNHAGRNELDASIMEGARRMAGAVAAVARIRNPIRAAERVMTRSQHVFLIGEGAEDFAREQGIAMVDPGYFRTEARWLQLQKALAAHSVLLDHDSDAPVYLPEDKRGTVGAVALDRHGNLAAGTSTGGMTNKRYGRVGDSPLIGAGTYADNRSVAVSATGTGEMFIRTAAAAHVAAQVSMLGTPIARAADNTLAEIAAIGGDGGLIVIDRAGNYAMRFTTAGMYRGTIGNEGIAEVGMFAEPEQPFSSPPRASS